MRLPLDGLPPGPYSVTRSLNLGARVAKEEGGKKKRGKWEEEENEEEEEGLVLTAPTPPFSSVCVNCPAQLGGVQGEVKVQKARKVVKETDYWW